MSFLQLICALVPSLPPLCFSILWQKSKDSKVCRNTPPQYHHCIQSLLFLTCVKEDEHGVRVVNHKHWSHFFGIYLFVHYCKRHGNQFGSISHSALNPLLQIYLEEAWQSTGKRLAVFAMLVKWTQCSYLVSTSLASAVSQGTSSITNGVFSATQQSLNCALCCHHQPLHCVLRGSTVSAQRLQILMGLWLEVLPGMTCNLIQAEVHCQGYITSKALLILPHVTHHTWNIYLHKRNMFSSSDFTLKVVHLGCGFLPYYTLDNTCYVCCISEAGWV